MVGLPASCELHLAYSLSPTDENLSGGWYDVQHPDGRVVWTTPSGRTYTTKPGSSLFFPATNITTAPIATGTPRPNSPDKHQQMPKRQRSRAKERAYRINAERALNDAHVTDNNNPPF